MTDSEAAPLMEALGRQAREDLEALDVDTANDPWAAALAEPLDDEFKASMVRRLQQAAEPAEVLPSPFPWFTVKTVSFAIAASFLMAVAAVFLIRTEAVLPAFSLDLQGTSAVRSSAEEVVKKGQLIRFRLRPETPVKGDVVIAVFVRDSEGALHRWPEAEALAVPRGDGTIWVENLPWRREIGEWTLLIQVLRPGDDVSTQGLATLSEREAGQWIEKDIRVIP